MATSTLLNLLRLRLLGQQLLITQLKHNNKYAVFTFRAYFEMKKKHYLFSGADYNQFIIFILLNFY